MKPLKSPGGWGGDFLENNRAATILRLLGNKTIQFSTRVKKSEPGLRKQLKIEVKSTRKFDFSLKIYEYIYMFF